MGRSEPTTPLHHCKHSEVSAVERVICDVMIRIEISESASRICDVVLNSYLYNTEHHSPIEKLNGLVFEFEMV